ncbi:hypothetical protein [Altererythrobacter fulvus]|uniref:hypothetical protein n=1 Tax=Caenibius fulvus TaxID=2126012 RepID=UPI0030169242
MDAIETMQAGLDYPYSAPMLRAMELGPYPFAVRIWVKAYALHEDGGDESTADLALFYDGAEVGRAHDEHFNNAYLAIEYSVIMGGGNVANFRLDSDNHRATERGYGFEFLLSRA